MRTVKTLTYDEVQGLIKYDEVMKRAYKKFREQHPRNRIIDMYYQMHAWQPIDEIYIKYLDTYECIRTFEYIESCKG